MTTQNDPSPSGWRDPGAATSTDPRTTSEVVASLIANLQALVKTEIELAKLEITTIVREKAIAVALIALGALLGLFILAFAGVTAAHAFMLIVAPWLAWLIVTGIYTLIAVIAMFVALRLLKRPTVPERTKADVKEAIEMAKRQVQP